MMHRERRTCGCSTDLDVNAAKTGIRRVSRGIVCQQILGPELIANPPKGFVELRHRSGVEILAAGIFGYLNERVLAAEIATRASFYGDDNDAVYNGFSFLGGTHGFLIVHAAQGVATVGDDYHDFPALAAIHRLRTQIDGVVERGGGAIVDAVNATVDGFKVRSEGNNFIHSLAEFVKAKGIDRAQNGVGKAPGRGQFQGQIFTCAEAGVNVHYDGKRQRRFFVEHRDGLRRAVFEQLEIVFGQSRHGSAVIVGDGDEDV